MFIRKYHIPNIVQLMQFDYYIVINNNINSRKNSQYLHFRVSFEQQWHFDQVIPMKPPKTLHTKRFIIFILLTMHNTLH